MSGVPGAAKTERRHEPDEQRHPLPGDHRDLGMRAHPPVAEARRRRSVLRRMPPCESLEQAASADVDEVSAYGTDATAAAEPPSAAGPHSAEPLSAEESRRRMLTARRRLLMMLACLEIAALALALTGLAAVWVVIPPTGMLAGYLLLLREAAKADAERARHEAEAAAHAAARARAARGAPRRPTACPRRAWPPRPRRSPRSSPPPRFPPTTRTPAATSRPAWPASTPRRTRTRTRPGPRRRGLLRQLRGTAPARRRRLDGASRLESLLR